MGTKQLAEDQFIAKFGEDADQQLFEDFYAYRDGKTPSRFTICDVHQHNAINYTFRACGIGLDGGEYLVECRDGDWDGSQILKFEPNGPMEKPEPTQYTFIPNRWLPAGLFGVYREWAKSAWFKEKAKGLNYDRFFAPGGATEKHYREWAESKGLKIATESEQSEYLSRGPMTIEDREVIEKMAEL